MLTSACSCLRFALCCSFQQLLSAQCDVTDLLLCISFFDSPSSLSLWRCGCLNQPLSSPSVTLFLSSLLSLSHLQRFAVSVSFSLCSFFLPSSFVLSHNCTCRLSHFILKLSPFFAFSSLSVFCPSFFACFSFLFPLPFLSISPPFFFFFLPGNTVDDCPVSILFVITGGTRRKDP